MLLTYASLVVSVICQLESDAAEDNPAMMRIKAVDYGNDGVSRHIWTWAPAKEAPDANNEINGSVDEEIATFERVGFAQRFAEDEAVWGPSPVSLQAGSDVEVTLWKTVCDGKWFLSMFLCRRFYGDSTELVGTYKITAREGNAEVETMDGPEDWKPTVTFSGLDHIEAATDADCASMSLRANVLPENLLTEGGTDISFSFTNGFGTKIKTDAMNSIGSNGTGILEEVSTCGFVEGDQLIFQATNGEGASLGSFAFTVNFDGPLRLIHVYGSIEDVDLTGVLDKADPVEVDDEDEKVDEDGEDDESEEESEEEAMPAEIKMFSQTTVPIIVVSSVLSSLVVAAIVCLIARRRRLLKWNGFETSAELTSIQETVI